MPEILKERSELDPQFQWDLTPMFESDAAWETALDSLDTDIESLAAFAGKLTDAVTIGAYLDASTEVGRKVERLYCYASQRHDEDTRDDKAQSMYARIGSKYVKMAAALSFAQPEILSLPEETLTAIVNDPAVADYKFNLEDLLRGKPHTLTKAEEKLLASFGEVMSAPSEIYHNLEDADLLFERQEGRGSVVICNHTSMAELLAVETALFFGGRRIRPIFKSEFAKSKIVRWAFSRVGGIPVERGTADMKCLRAAQHALQRGEDVLIFPEGTRIRSREIKPEVHGGFALIAQMGKAPVNPLAICGWSDITPAGKKLMRPKKCWIRAGKAVSLSDAPAGLKRTERLEWFESEAMNRVYAMRDDLCDEHPGRF